MIAIVTIVTIVVSILPVVSYVYASNSNYTNAIKALEGKECPMLPSSETIAPVQQMRCHDPECQVYLFAGNQTTNATMEKKCWEPAKDQTLGSLVS
jgi:hypothetical protein